MTSFILLVFSVNKQNMTTSLSTNIFSQLIQHILQIYSNNYCELIYKNIQLNPPNT
jgi:hypothetical protein